MTFRPRWVPATLSQLQGWVLFWKRIRSNWKRCSSRCSKRSSCIHFERCLTVFGTSSTAFAYSYNSDGRQSVSHLSKLSRTLGHIATTSDLIIETLKYSSFFSFYSFRNFFFLRLICPAIVNPKLHHLCAGE